MPVIFLSHSSRDDRIVRQLEAWLIARGFDDLFIDHSDIRGGDKWTESLRRAKGACRIVLCLVTPQWLASDECFGEFTAAWYQGKRIIPLLAVDGAALDEIQERRFRRITGEDQGFDIVSALSGDKLDPDRLTSISEPLQAGLRAGGGLAKIGLDPHAFEIDRALQPAPYPGLESFTDNDADAAIFFGRSTEISRCLEDLREMRAKGARQPYAMLGASGSGKSSLMKAGLLPRLRRERGWIVLRAFRPGADPLLNFATSLARTLNDLGDPSAAGPIRDSLRDAWRDAKVNGSVATEHLGALAAVLEVYFARLRDRAYKPGAAVLIPLDQAEELARQDGESGDVLCDYFRAALAEQLPVDGAQDTGAGSLIVFTVRTDSFPELQRARRFLGLDARCADIRPVPVHRFADVIEGPAARYGIQIDPDLVEVMIEDIPGEDALPLLAFALQRLWQQYQSEARLRLKAYENVGKLAGLIEDAAERALRGIRPDDESPMTAEVPGETERLAARTFVPPLAQVSEIGTTTRRVAPIDRFSDKARDLIEHFVSWRLLVCKRETEGTSGTVEIAHESIFRAWPRLQRWIEPEKNRLQTLLDLENSARLWDRHGRTPSYVDHRGVRLRQARALLEHEDFSREISNVEKSYLERASALERRRRAVIVVTASGALLAGLFTLGILDTMSMHKALREAAMLHIRSGNPMVGGAYAVAGASGAHDMAHFFSTPKADLVLWETGLPIKVLVDIRNEYDVYAYGFSPDGKRLVTRSADEAGAIWDVDKGVKLAKLGEDGEVARFDFYEDSSRLIVRSSENSLALWDVNRGEKIAKSGAATYKTSAFSEKTHRFVTLSESGTCILWDLLSGRHITVVGVPNEISDFGLSEDVPRMIVRSRAGVTELWDTEAGKKLVNLGGAGCCDSYKMAPKGFVIFTVNREGQGRFFDALTGLPRLAPIKDKARISGWGISSDGRRLITRSIYNKLVLWDTQTGARIGDVGISDSENWSFSPSGQSFITRSTDSRAELRNTKDGTILRVIDRGQAKHYFFSKMGERLVSTALDRSATLWDAATGAKLAVLAGPGVVDHIIFSDNGKRLSVASVSSRGSLWDSEHGRKLRDYRRVGEDAGGSFSKSGTRYATSSANNFGALWDATTGRFLAEMGGEGANADVTLSADGSRAVVQSTEDTAVVLDVSNLPIDLKGAELRERVCAINRDVVGIFPQNIREGATVYGVRLSQYLRGRPWNPCDWRGLMSIEGWAQALRYWAVKVGISWDYECDETVFGKTDPTAVALCRTAMPRTPALKAKVHKR
jgi:WD40 repeat protein